MPQPVLYDNQGRLISLGPELGRGGEAAVYAVEGQPALVAKMYHQPPGPEKAEKLSRMVELQNERLLALSAWPVGTIFNAGDRSLVGFLMKNMKGFKDIHLLYNPKSRTREFPPKANWRFLIHTASNVARAFSAIHDHGHVIGDVNQSNVRVSPETAIVGLIDCDSFQISANGKLYPCEVGVPLYTPPEMQETEFREVVRTANHDNFGLAILIFHLLFMGRHPFAGKFLGRGEMPIEKAISEHRFAFSADQARTRMLPPPACITLAHLPHEVGDLFTRAFSPDAVHGGRPDGRQWMAAMDALSNRLIVCSVNKAHIFFNELPSCPWCAIESSGVLLFIDYTIVDTSSGFTIEHVWSHILAVPNPGPGNPPSLLTYMHGVTPSPRANAAMRMRRYKIAAMSVAAFCLFAAVIIFKWGLEFLLGLSYFSLLVRPVAKILKEKFWNASADFSQTARAAEARLRYLQESWKEEASGAPFNETLDRLRMLTQEYRQLPETRKKKIRELERALRDIQLRHYLQQFTIAHADLPHIKDGRKAMLSAYGIDDAADITPSALQAVPGFGQFLAMQLITWRQSLEARFKFNPGRGVDPVDIQQVDNAIAKRRTEIEQLLAKGPAELKLLRTRILASRSRLQSQLEQALTEVAQAQADESAAA
jgi:DNA-binding helix-hairpin-helix protein with protein kinase domain